MIQLALTEISIGYLLNKKQGGLEVGQTKFSVWHNMDKDKLEYLVGEFMDAQPPTLTSDLFCLYVALYAEIHNEEIMCLTEEMYAQSI